MSVVECGEFMANDGGCVRKKFGAGTEQIENRSVPRAGPGTRSGVRLI